MIDGQNAFDQPVRNDLRTYGNIRKISVGQGDDYTGCLLNYLNGDPKSNQQSNFIDSLDRTGQVAMFFPY